MEDISADAASNRRHWDAIADTYQAEHAGQLDTAEPVWGVWNIPERDLRVLGDVRDRDVLELGCGAARWSILLAGLGARPVGLDNSARQLEHAERAMARSGTRFPLVHASAENVPLPDSSFDVVFCDHGAATFSEPQLVVPEAYRLLRPGGVFAFNMTSPLADVCWSDEDQRIDSCLHQTYYDMHRWEFGDEVVFQLPYGGWIRLFRQAGFVVEDLIEPRPPEDAVTTYRDYPLQWARRWPVENIWKVRKPG